MCLERNLVQTAWWRVSGVLCMEPCSVGWREPLDFVTALFVSAFLCRGLLDCKSAVMERQRTVLVLSSSVQLSRLLNIQPHIACSSAALYAAESLEWMVAFIIECRQEQDVGVYMSLPFLFMLQCLCSPESCLRMHARSTSRASRSGKFCQPLCKCYAFE